MRRSLGQCGYRLVVVASDTPGQWREVYRREGIGSRKTAELLGREETIRLEYRTTWRKIAWRVEEDWRCSKLS